MSLISASIPNLINGISQQPASLRLKTQGEKQINGLSSVVNGLSKRPPTQLIETLDIEAPEDAFIHTVRRDKDEFYTIIITKNPPSHPTNHLGCTIQVISKDGAEKTVNSTQSGDSYLTGVTKPSEDIAATTIADYTFILNKKQVTSKSGSNLSAERAPEALVYLKQSDYATTYKLRIKKNGVYYTRSITTKASNQSSNNELQDAESSIQTDRIIGSLNPLNGIDSLYGGGSALTIPGLLVSEYGNVLWIRTNDGDDFEIETTDSRGDTQLFVFKELTTDFKKLPPDGPDGFVIGVTGDNDKGQDDYYVTLKTGTYGQQVWDETIKPGIETSFNDGTMPHQLVSEADGTFTFEPMSFAEREVGDDDTNPFPSFIGYNLQDIFFHRNRLGFLADENVILAESGEFTNFNFFKKTTLTIVDSDPIDVAVSNDKVSLLKFAVPFNEELLLFSDQTQFKLTATDTLTPETVSINVTTQFEASLDAKPVSAGRYVYFAMDRGKWSGVREYYVDVSSDVDDAADITAHVPRYLEGTVKKMEASSNEDMVLCLCEDDPKSVYVYKYYWQGTEKLQSSWSKWTFAADVLNVSFNKSQIDMILAYKDTSGNIISITLERINLSVDDESIDVTGNFSVHLDRREVLDHLNLTPTEYTPFISLTPDVPDFVYITDKGSQIDAANVNNYVTTATNNQGKVFVGIPYLFEYEVSEQVISQNNEPMSTGRLQLRNMTLLYSNTGYFETDVTATSRNTSTATFNGQKIGAASLILGSVSLDAGKFKFPILSKSDEVKITIKSDSHLPCTFQSAELEGYFVMRSRKL